MYVCVCVCVCVGMCVRERERENTRELNKHICATHNNPFTSSNAGVLAFFIKRAELHHVLLRQRQRHGLALTMH